MEEKPLVEVSPETEAVITEKKPGIIFDKAMFDAWCAREFHRHCAKKLGLIPSAQEVAVFASRMNTRVIENAHGTRFFTILNRKNVVLAQVDLNIFLCTREEFQQRIEDIRAKTDVEAKRKAAVAGDVDCPALAEAG